ESGLARRLRGVEDTAGGALVYVERGERPLVPLEVLLVAVHRREGAGRALRKEVRWNRVRHELDESGGLLAPPEEIAHDRLRRPPRGVHDRLGDVHLLRDDRRDIDR